MNRIDLKRMLAGGLLAGVIINIGEFILNMPVAGDAMNAALQEAGLPEPGGGAIALYVALAFALGITGVWLYAAIRPRYGPGPGTAVRAGLALWLLASAFHMVGMLPTGLYPTGLAALAMVWALIEFPLAVLAGAWLYRETEPAAAAASEAPREASAPRAPAGGDRTAGGGTTHLGPDDYFDR